MQLHDIDIPLQVNERKLFALIRDLEKEKEASIKQEMIVKKETELIVSKVKNEANEIVEKAKAEYELVLDQAESNYSRIIESTHNEGLKKMFDDLGLTSAKQKSSLNYIRALREHEKVKYSIDFNTLITNSK